MWAKPGGELDETSDEAPVLFDENCRDPIAKQPAPGAGEWYNGSGQGCQPAAEAHLVVDGKCSCDLEVIS